MVYYRRRRGGYRRRRPSYRRRFKRGPGYRRGYRRFRRRGAYPPKRGSFTGWPEINYVKHVWRDSYRVGPSGSGSGSINFAGAIRANAVADPWYTVDTQSCPSRFTEMSTFYSKHTVLGSKITVIMSGPTGLNNAVPPQVVRTDQTEYVAVIRKNDDNGAATMVATDEIMAAPDRKNFWKRCQLAPMLSPVTAGTTVAGGDCSKTSVKLTANWSLKRDCGVQDSSSPDWSATGSNVPNNGRYYLFGLGFADTAQQGFAPGYLVEVRIEYFVKWENLKDLSYVKA